MYEYVDRLERILDYLAGDDDKKWDEILAYTKKIINGTEMRDYRAFTRIIKCENYKEVAEYCRDRENKKSLGADAIRKRVKKTIGMIEDTLMDEFGDG